MKDEFRRRGSARDRILARLQQGPATNAELNDICFRFGARILELREQGHAITTEAIDGGLFRYSLAAPAPKPDAYDANQPFQLR